MGKPEGRRPLGRPRRRWMDNIRMDLQEVGCGYMDWIGLAQYRDRWRTLVSAVMNLRVPCHAGNFLTSCKPVSFSRRTLHHGVSKLAQGRRRTDCYLVRVNCNCGFKTVTVYCQCVCSCGCGPGFQSRHQYLLHAAESFLRS